jgi:aspartyl-tRNA(Asn)/glutamyl-tRNA(Gln) amidotransferase subunit A
VAIWDLSAHALRDEIASRGISSAEAVDAYLRRIEALDGRVGAFLELHEDEAREAARRVDAALAAGHAAGPLAGVPVAVKDNICVKGRRTSCASRLLSNYTPPYDAFAVEKLRAAGAVILGKTNLDEFAMGSSTEHSAFGPTHNPWDAERVAGGSSGGSAAAVALGMAPAALGSDTGGSVRQPGAFCGVAALKPTYGTISRRGLVAFASSLDQIGPIGRDVGDCLLVYNALCGHDPDDATSARGDHAVDPGALAEGARGLSVGVPRAWLAEGLDSDVEAALARAEEALAEAGAAVREVTLLDPSYAVAAYYIIATAEASSNLARYDGVRYGRRAAVETEFAAMIRRTRSEGFGAEVRRRIVLGTYVLSAGYYDAYYLRAQRARRRIHDDFERAFAEVDVILLPTTPAPAFRLGEKTGDPLAMYLSDIFTVPLNLYAGPGINLPAGRSAGGLPIGVQILAPRFGEAAMFRAARALEERVGLLGTAAA